MKIVGLCEIHFSSNSCKKQPFRSVYYLCTATYIPVFVDKTDAMMGGEVKLDRHDGDVAIFQRPLIRIVAFIVVDKTTF